MERQQRPKIYRGYSEDADSAMGPVAVMVEVEGRRRRALRHRVRHSPTGFSWGYAGSGPADLARSILADYLGYIPHPTIYQHFKFSHVSRWEQGRPWQITSRQIDIFLTDPRVSELVRQRAKGDPDLGPGEDEPLPF